MERARVVIVTGTPGTGKTTLARRLAKALKCGYVDVNKVVEEEGLREGYDRGRKTFIVDEGRLAKAIEKRIRSAKVGMVIDSHMSHMVSPSLVDSCLVTTCGLKTLDRRLRKKGYGRAKVDENVQAEIFDTCAQEARELGHKPVMIDTTKGIDLKRVLALVKKGMKKKK